ncbi:hypothetical protein [Kitasatospora phosalacinea]|uniref:Uncharacterized protein n=1 Tax=Kitasatospora phosalacinea TaxID=2065 RepID=A0A9W6PBM8_9ACTN|nr:hypothetical protein [Kitasatospora phosalacinea]GLW52028.1 hypothetical protein Kpho01_00390 [Kitasatospora phosalacinea]
MRRLFDRWIPVVVCAVCLSSGGCAEVRGGGPPSAGTASSAPAGGAALSRAAEEVDRLVRERFTAWYAGTVLDQGSGTVTVYRKPGSGLDAAVRARATGVVLVLRPAALSREEMLALVRRIIGDAPYWREQGIAVTGGGPLEDGSGVSVMTPTGAPDEAARLTGHYGSKVVVERGSPVPAVGGLVVPPSASGQG